MPNITSFVVVPFVSNAIGVLTPGEPTAAPDGETARRLAKAMAAASGHVGAVALCREEAETTDVFAKGVMIAGFGDFDLDALARRPIAT